MVVIHEHDAHFLNKSSTTYQKKKKKNIMVVIFPRKPYGLFGWREEGGGVE